MRQIACPIALHPDGTPRRLPVFQHPTAGLQLIHAELKPDERPDAAAARAAFAQSGLETRSALYLGASTTIQPETEWHFSLCRIAPPVRDHWAHLVQSNEGALLKFHWLSLDAAAPQDINDTFRNAFMWIQANL